MNKFIKKIFILIFFVFIFIHFNIIVKANTWNLDVMNLPVITESVVDFTNTLSSEQLTNLIKISKDFEAKTTNQIVVVLIPDREWNELFDISMKIFKANKFWQAWADNWVLLVIAVNEKKIRIVTGYWVEAKIPDNLASNIIENYIRPEVNKGNIYQWVLNYYTYTMQALEWEYTITTKSDLSIYIFLIIFIIFIILWAINRKKGWKNWVDDWIYYSWSDSWWWGRSGGWWDSGGWWAWD